MHKFRTQAEPNIEYKLHMLLLITSLLCFEFNMQQLVSKIEYRNVLANAWSAFGQSIYFYLPSLSISREINLLIK